MAKKVVNIDEFLNEKALEFVVNGKTYLVKDIPVESSKELASGGIDSLRKAVARMFNCDEKELANLGQGALMKIIEEANKNYNRKVKGISDELMEKLINYPWPGNIRQLKNIITNAVLLCNDDIITEIELFKPSISRNNIDISNMDYKAGLKNITSKFVEQIEKQIIQKALNDYNRNLSKTAEALKITRKTLYEKIEKYSL